MVVHGLSADKESMCIYKQLEHIVVLTGADSNMLQARADMRCCNRMGPAQMLAASTCIIPFIDLISASVHASIGSI